MSASSHTRDHRHAWEATRGVMTWLEAHGRRVINNRLATAYEVSKVEQILTLRDHGLSVPRSMAATGRKALLSAAQHWGAPFIVKPNRGGKGTGVTLVRSPSELQAIADDFDSYTLDGQQILVSLFRNHMQDLWLLNLVLLILQYLVLLVLLLLLQ